ncbi:MAG: hypothetical protein P1V97_19525 [Planctomycetota bacterium]|nr:hypothetical protein [Planctomycetota bacterium]
MRVTHTNMEPGALPKDLEILFDWDIVMMGTIKGQRRIVEPCDLPLSAETIEEFDRVYRIFSNLMFEDSEPMRDGLDFDDVDWRLFHGRAVKLWRSVYEQLRGLRSVALRSSIYHMRFSSPRELDAFEQSLQVELQ